MDGSLYGWGMDFVYHNILGLQHRDKYAILHSSVCRNPAAAEKPGGAREISLLASDALRSRQWRLYRAKHRLGQPQTNVYSCLPAYNFTGDLPGFCKTGNPWPERGATGGSAE